MWQETCLCVWQREKEKERENESERERLMDQMREKWQLQLGLHGSV